MSFNFGRYVTMTPAHRIDAIEFAPLHDSPEMLDLAQARRAYLASGPRNVPLRKTIVTRRALRGVFKRVLDKRQSRLGGERCCAAPMPFHATPASPGAPNWQIRAPVKCARGCDFVVRGIQKELRDTYDLVPPPVKSRVFRLGVASLICLSAFFYYLAWVAR